MKPANGYNPMRWDCGARGCYNLKQRPKIEQFAQFLPGRIAMSDVDAIVEVNGRFLLLEWKTGTPRDLQTGQRILAERMTAATRAITYVVVWGDPEFMTTTHVMVFWNGKSLSPEPCDFEALCRRISQWSQRAMSTARPRRIAA